MDESLQCGRCGIWVHCFLRTCPECGEPLFLALDPRNAKPENFFDLMTSLYNLVADKENPRRVRYLPGISERVIERRCEIEFQDEAHVFGFGLANDENWPEELRDIYAMALTNTLTGYIYRYVEEFILGGKNGELGEAERKSLISTLLADESGFNESCFRVLNSENEIDRRVLFCLALRINANYIRYLLADEGREDEWFNCILEQSIEKTTYFYGMAFRALWPDQDLRQFLARRRNTIRENVQKDFLFGYVVRLSETLHPVSRQASSHLH